MLHKLHIVHQDIKPDNIMMSPTFQKLVFIDFGLSTFIKEKIGKKKLTFYVGTAEYWSPEMTQCFIQKKSSKIDLYYNDFFGLSKSIEEINHCFENIEDSKLDENEVFASERIVFQYLNAILLKSFLYEEKFGDFKEYWKK